MVVPAAALGALIVFGIGLVLTHTVVSRIEGKLEERMRKRSGLIPPLNQTTLDVTTISIAGGVVAVVLVLTILFAVPRESQALIWYGLTGIGIIGGFLTFVLFRSESDSTASPKTPRDPISEQSKEPQKEKEDDDLKGQSSKADLYHLLLLKAKNNRDLADRLIEYERKRKPDASEAELIKSAIERWELDNR
jgi:hypothetical protein